MNSYYSNTSFYQVRLMYNININRSNVFYQLRKLNKIKDLMLIDLAKGENFIFEYVDDNGDDEFLNSYFGDDNIQTIDYYKLVELFEDINNHISYLSKQLEKYKSYGKKVTEQTKLYDILEYLDLQEHAKHGQTIDYNKIEKIIKENTSKQDEIKIADRLYSNILKKEIETSTSKNSVKDEVRGTALKDSFKSKKR